MYTFEKKGNIVNFEYTFFCYHKKNKTKTNNLLIINFFELIICFNIQ